jgi:signal transduction histidine kinase/CheY-like chemotaxis protein
MAQYPLDSWELLAEAFPSAAGESLPSLIEKLPVAAYTCDADGLITYFNPEALRLWGRAPKLRNEVDRFCGSFRLFSADATPIPHDRCWMALALETGRDFTGCEIIVERPDGQRRAVLAHAIPIRTSAGRVVGAVNVLVDITARKEAEDERRKLEEQMRHTQKLEGLGVLAGGLAHEFNNLLTPVLGYATLAAREVPPDSHARRMLDEISQAASRASALTRQMVAYSGRAWTVIEELSLDDLLRDMKALLETVVSKTTRFELSLAPAMVRVDATQIRQVVMNLITNAAESIAGQQGVISVRTGSRTMDAMSLRSPYLRQELPPGRYAYIEVADTGAGMTPDMLDKVFDPFFTTKFKGRGLGLAAVLGIVWAHNGTVHVTSAPSEGTTFEVYLPTAAMRIERDGADGDPRREPPDGCTVLVVEDEASVRSFVASVLETAGFEVLLADDGGAGLDVFGQHRDDIDLVVLDLTMPRLGGWEVAARLQQERPELPVLLMSGYSEPETPAAYEQVRLAGFLEKPFAARDLLTRACDIVAEDPGAAAGRDVTRL